MKYLIILLLFVSVNCFGQKDTSGIIFTTGIYLSVDSTIQQTTDTISCIMLICDTSRQKIGSYFESDSIQSNTINPLVINGKWHNVYSQPNSFVFWKKGYEVRNKSWICCDPYDNWSAKYYWFYTHIKYIDEDKKPLSENIIVWISKTFK